MQSCAMPRTRCTTPISDGYHVTRELWEEKHTEAVDLCRSCHKMAPFCFYNGNTFASIVLLTIRKMGLPPDEEYIFRSLAGHIVAGVASEEEEKAVAEFFASCSSSPKKVKASRKTPLTDRSPARLLQARSSGEEVGGEIPPAAACAWCGRVPAVGRISPGRSPD